MNTEMFTKIKNLLAPKELLDESLKSIDGCYASKFLRSSARRFLLEMLGTMYEVARAGLVH